MKNDGSFHLPALLDKLNFLTLHFSSLQTIKFCIAMCTHSSGQGFSFMLFTYIVQAHQNVSFE